MPKLRHDCTEDFRMLADSFAGVFEAGPERWLLCWGRAYDEAVELGQDPPPELLLELVVRWDGHGTPEDGLEEHESLADALEAAAAVRATWASVK